MLLSLSLFAARRATLVRGAATLALGAALSGCVVAPARPVHADGGLVTVAPPAPYHGALGVAPAPGYVWIDGHWGWSGHRHVWVPGRWHASRPGYHHMPHAWGRHGGGWRQQPGRWRRR